MLLKFYIFQPGMNRTRELRLQVPLLPGRIMSCKHCTISALGVVGVCGKQGVVHYGIVRLPGGKYRIWRISTGKWCCSPGNSVRYRIRKWSGCPYNPSVRTEEDTLHLLVFSRLIRFWIASLCERAEAYQLL